MPDLYFRKETHQEAKINSEHSYDKRQQCSDNHCRTQQSTCRLNVKGLEDFTLSESKRRRGHPTRWARQTRSLLESTVAEPSARVDFVMSGRRKKAKE